MRTVFPRCRAAGADWRYRRHDFIHITLSVINFLAAVLFGMLGVGAAPVFIATIQSLGYATVATVFPLAILLNDINSGFALIPFFPGEAG